MPQGNVSKSEHVSLEINMINQQMDKLHKTMFTETVVLLVVLLCSRDSI
jgi:hypothetical protein